MNVYYDLGSFRKGVVPGAATIGTFDGLHLGHRKIIAQLLDAAARVGGASTVISFHPHPRLVLFPEDNPLRLLHTLEERIASFRETGIDNLLLIPFTKEFSRLTSERFIDEVLVKAVGIHTIVIGYDHHFGKNRTGGLKELEEAGRLGGFEVEEIPAEQVDSANVSSTKIRKALQEGDVATANRYLSYAYPLSGTVVHGQKLGRTIGYPTANIQPEDPYKLIPGEGVYFVSVSTAVGQHYGMCNIGRKPTVGEHPLGVEVHIFDFDADLYDQRITLNFLDWIRADQKFNGLEALVAAIAADEAACRALIATIKQASEQLPPHASTPATEQLDND
jgi:riboflavin kinase / FMN adenylyltransferase